MKKTIYFIIINVFIFGTAFIIQSKQTAMATKYVVTTLAGSKQSFEEIDGPGDKATFSDRLGTITLGPNGHLYALEHGVIRKIAPDGRVSTLFKTLGKPMISDDGLPMELTSGKQGLSGILVTKDKFLIDNGTGRYIFKVVNEMTVEKFAGSTNEYKESNPNGDGSLSEAILHGPMDMCMDKAGNIYLNDRYRMVRKISPSGKVTTLVGKRDDVYAPGALEPELKTGKGPAASLHNISGMVVDSKGNLFVSQSEIRCIVKITPDGTVKLFAGDPSDTDSYITDGIGTAARFVIAGPLAIDGNDNIYVADHRKIRKITPDGTVTTIAGASKEEDYTTEHLDGDSKTAIFHTLTGITCDSSGKNIYVTDYCRVRKVSAQ
jgi:hypothetical protein